MRQLRNFTEESIRAFIDQELPLHDVCQCDYCRLDILAIMLNEFKAHYVVTDVGALFAQMAEQFEPQFKIDLLSSLSHAIQIVKDRPRHEPNDPSSPTRPES